MPCRSRRSTSWRSSSCRTTPFSMSARSWRRRSRKAPKRRPVSGSRPPSAPFKPSISPVSAPSPRAAASACVNLPSWKPCWMSPSCPRCAASRRSRSSCPASAWSSALARSESSMPSSSRNFWRSSSIRWKASGSSSRACCVAAVISSITAFIPEKKRSKSRSNVATSTARLTAVARSAARTVARSVSPIVPSARSASMVSDTDTRKPFCRSSPQNSTILSSIVGSGARSAVLVQDVLLFGSGRWGGRVLCLFRPLKLAELLELLLRLPDVSLVLEDDGERLGHEILIEVVDVQEQEGPRPVERLADARVLLQIELPDALDQRHDLARQLLADAGDLELHDGELVRAIREVDVEVEAAPLERIGQLARVVAREHHGGDMTRTEGSDLGHAHLEVGEDLQEEGLELGVRLVDLVDEQDR